MEYKQYVCGFLFDKALDNVLMIKKARPRWQVGKLNGIGGKIEETDASQMAAMSREYREEVGDGRLCLWVPFSHLCGTDGDGDMFRVNFFYAVSVTNEPLPDTRETDADEPVFPVSLSHFSQRTDTIPSIRWFMQMALTCIEGKDSCKYFAIDEMPNY